MFAATDIGAATLASAGIWRIGAANIVCGRSCRLRASFALRRCADNMFCDVAGLLRTDERHRTWRWAANHRRRRRDASLRGAACASNIDRSSSGDIAPLYRFIVTTTAGAALPLIYHFESARVLWPAHDTAIVARVAARTGLRFTARAFALRIVCVCRVRLRFPHRYRVHL